MCNSVEKSLLFSVGTVGWFSENVFDVGEDMVSKPSNQVEETGEPKQRGGRRTPRMRRTSAQFRSSTPEFYRCRRHVTWSRRPPQPAVDRQPRSVQSSDGRPGERFAGRTSILASLRQSFAGGRSRRGRRHVARSRPRVPPPAAAGHRLSLRRHPSPGLDDILPVAATSGIPTR